jgi:hypothetical protein
VGWQNPYGSRVRVMRVRVRVAISQTKPIPVARVPAGFSTIIVVTHSLSGCQYDPKLLTVSIHDFNPPLQVGCDDARTRIAQALHPNPSSTVSPNLSWTHSDDVARHHRFSCQCVFPPSWPSVHSSIYTNHLRVSFSSLAAHQLTLTL